MLDTLVQQQALALLQTCRGIQILLLLAGLHL
jgi:hypothetical protein